MEGVRGYTWATFEEKAREIESLSGWPPSRKPLSPNAGRLCREDMAIYGEEPAIDSLSLVVCGQCSRVIKSQALLQHIKHYHADMVNIPAPHSVAPPPLGGVHTVGQPSSAVSTNDSSSSGNHYDGGVAPAGVTGFTASQLPTSSGGGSGRSNKEYDPNKHCGVWISETKKHCTHSLTCKEHPVSERRKVIGRSRTFDELLDEHKKKKKMRKLEKLKSDADLYLNQQSSTSHSPPLRSPTRSSSRFDPSSPSGGEGGAGGRRGEGGGGGGGGRRESVSTATRTSVPSTPVYPRSTDLDDFPKPLAACSFGGRSQLGGGLRFSRKQDNLRSALAHLSGRSQDYTQTTLHRKHSYNSLLQQKRSQRKYFKLQQQASSVAESSSSTPGPSSSSQPRPLSSSLTLPLNPDSTYVDPQDRTASLTPSQPATLNSPPALSPPIYPSTVLADLSRWLPPSSVASSQNPPPPSATPLAPPLSTPSAPQTGGGGVGVGVGPMGGSASNSQQNVPNPLQLPQNLPMQPVISTPSTVTPFHTQRSRGASVSAMMTTPESVLNPGLANGDISRESMETDSETPLTGQGTVSSLSSSSLVNPPPAPPTTAAPAQTSNRRLGKKKKKRGRKPKDKSQVDNSTVAATSNAQGMTAVESAVVQQQQNAIDQHRTTTPVGGGVVGGASGHHVHAGEDALRTSREQLEIERRRSIGSSSSISVPPLPSNNPHHLNNSYASTSQQAQLASETGQSRLTDHHRAPSSTTPSRESAGAGVVGGLPLGPGCVVRIKQEPITNHEEEMETNQPPVHQHQRQPTTKSQSVVLNGMVTPPSGSGSPSLHPSFGSQTFVINPTGQHSSPTGHPLMTSLSPHLGGILPIRPSQLFSTSTGLAAHQLQMLHQQRSLLQQLQQQQMLQQAAAAASGGGGGGGSLGSPQSSLSLGSSGRTSTNPIQNSITAGGGGGLVMTASGHGFQHSFHVAQGGTESSSPRGSLSSQSAGASSGGLNRIRAPISHIPSGNPAAFQDVRTMPRLNALSQSTNKSLLHQGKQSLNSGHSQQVT